MISAQTKYILWDWNGTLLDDALLTFEAMMQVFNKHRLPNCTFEEYLEKFRIPVAAFYHDIGIDVSKLSMKTLAEDFHLFYEGRQHEFKLQGGVVEALSAVRGTGRPQSIFSAHPQAQIESAVTHLKIGHHFNSILGATSNQGVSKVEHGRKWFQSSGLDPSEITLIGDTDHDAEVAHELGFNCILIAAGHQNEKVLKRSGYPVLNSLQHFMTLL